MPKKPPQRANLNSVITPTAYGHGNLHEPSPVVIDDLILCVREKAVSPLSKKKKTAKG